MGSTFTFNFKLENELLNQSEGQTEKRSDEFKLNSKKLVFMWKPEGLAHPPVGMIQKSKPRPILYINNLDMD
jgi:hypothetical protein